MEDKGNISSKVEKEKQERGNGGVKWKCCQPLRLKMKMLRKERQPQRRCLRV